MRLIKIIKDWQKKKLIMKMVSKENPLHTLEYHALYTNLHLRKRNDIEIGKYTYGSPNVRSGGGLLNLKLAIFLVLDQMFRFI